MPSNPIYWGVWREDQSVNGDTTQIGYVDGTGETLSTSIDNEWTKRPSIAMLNKPWVSSGAYVTVSSLTSGFTTIRNHGQVPLLAWRTEAWGGLGTLPSLSLTSIASGAHDAGFLTPFATAIAALRYPVLILIDEEMNGSWNPNWYDATGVNFVSMWQHIVTVFRNAGATNASWVWCPNGIAPGGSFTNWWPGAAYVDWAVFDTFNPSYIKGMPWLTFDQIAHGDLSNWGDSWDALLALDTTGKVHFGLGSFGSDDQTQAGASNFTQAASWVTDAFGIQIPHGAGAARDYSKLEMVLWFDQNERNAGLSDGVEHWNISGYPLGTDTARSAAAQGPSGIGSGYYLAGNKFTLPSGLGPLRPYSLTVPTDPLSDVIGSTTALQGFWWCNDSTNTLADQSGNGRTLAANGAVVLNQTGIVPSTPHTAVSFPGATTAWLDGGNLDAWSIANTGKLSGGIAFTLPAGWVAGTAVTLMGVNGSDGVHYEWALGINASGVAEFDVYSLGGGTHSSAAGGGVLVAGVPYTAVFTMDSAKAGSASAAPQANVYLFSSTAAAPSTVGSADDLTQVLATTANGTGTLQIGRRGDVSRPLPSGTKVQYAFLTSTELTPVTVQAYLRGFQAVACTSVAASAVTGSTATITWTTDQASDSVVNYGPAVPYAQQTLVAATAVTSHSVALSGLTAGVVYHYQVLSRNAAGAVGASADATFTTSSVTGQAVLTWTTDQPASSWVEYGLTTAYGTLTPLDPLRVTSHSVTITTAFTANTTYHWRAHSRNAAGTEALSADQTFVTGTSPSPVLSSISPTTLVVGGGPVTVTFTGTNTTWLSLGVPTITVSSGSLGAITATSNTAATATFTPPGVASTVTFTDTTDTSSTATITVTGLNSLSSISPSSLVIGSGPVTVTFTGTGTSWISTAAPTITVSAGSLGLITATANTTASATFTPPAVVGVVTFTDTTDRNTTATVTITPAKTLSISPTQIALGGGPVTVTFTGTNTTWQSVGVPSITPGAGSLGALTATSNTTATATYTPPGVAQNVTFTDTTDGNITTVLSVSNTIVVAPQVPGMPPALVVEVTFVSNPSEPPVWVDLTRYVQGTLVINRGRQRELDQIQAGTLSCHLDNRSRAFDPTFTGSPYYPNVLPMRRIRVRATYNGSNYPLFTGYVESWGQSWSGWQDATVEVQATDAFVALNLAQVNQAFPAERSDQRVTDVLSAINWTVGGAAWTVNFSTLANGSLPLPADLSFLTVVGPTGDRVLTPGSSTIQATTLADTSALSHLQDVVSTELGLLFTDRNGSITFYGRSHAVLTAQLASQATFGELELPYVDVVLAYDATQIWNDIRVTRIGGVQQTATSASSQTHYYQRTLSKTSSLQDSDAAALSVANALLLRYAEPTLQIVSLALDGEADPTNAYPQMLTRELGDRVTVRRRPPAGGQMIEQVSIIQGISIQYAVTGTAWQVDWRLSPADPHVYWVLGDTANGVLGTTSRLFF